MASSGFFESRVPRYASYPTEPHFGTEVAGVEFRDWLGRVAPGSKISLYIHVPFCRRLCWFCACRTQGTCLDAPVAHYVEVLKSEIALLRASLPEDLQLQRVHWGGGSPSILTPGMILELAAAQHSLAPLAENARFSVEIVPNEIDAARLDALMHAGMNRAIISLQDFDPLVQKTIGRIQSFETTYRAVKMLRTRGLRSLSAEILFGLPHQTEASLSESVQMLMALSPNRVAVHRYVHMPRVARRQNMIPVESLPGSEASRAMFKAARSLLLWDGYHEIGINHFARKGDGLMQARLSGKLRRGFNGYSTSRTEVLVGVGASAISRFPQGYAQNATGTGDYARTIKAGRLATARGHVLQDEDRLRGRLIESLLCQFRIDRQEILSRFDLEPEALQALLQATADQFDGQLQLDERGLSIPPQARGLTRKVARSLDSYALDKTGHAPPA